MKIKREEKTIFLVPETDWEYDQLKDLLYKRIEISGFEHDWEGNWGLKGGLRVKLKDPYDD